MKNKYTGLSKKKMKEMEDNWTVITDKIKPDMEGVHLYWFYDGYIYYGYWTERQGCLVLGADGFQRYEGPGVKSFIPIFQPLCPGETNEKVGRIG